MKRTAALDTIPDGEGAGGPEYDIDDTTNAISFQPEPKAYLQAEIRSHGGHTQLGKAFYCKWCPFQVLPSPISSSRAPG